MDNQIKSVCARQIFDSKCRPIIEVDVITEGGVLGRGSASTGTSVGMYEAVIDYAMTETIFQTQLCRKDARI